MRFKKTEAWQAIEQRLRKLKKNSYEHEEEEYSNDVGYAANAAEDASAAHRKSGEKKV